jgi:excisionase family DNA binding protein
MVTSISHEYLSASEAAIRLGVTPRRVYALIDSGRLPAVRVGGHLVIARRDVESREQDGAALGGRPFSVRRVWGLVLLADGRPAPGLDPPTRSRLRKLLRERTLWSIRARLVGRAERQGLRAHPSDLARLDAEPGLIRTGPRFAADAGLGLIAPDAVRESYVTGATAEHLRSTYRLAVSDRPNIILRVMPDDLHVALGGPFAPHAAIALDLAEDPDPRSQSVAREVLGG